MNCPNGFWCFQMKDIVNILILVVTIFAVWLGPIRAVQVSRRNDEEREKRRRQYAIFHSLMKTRRVALDPEHVMALNVIVIEFYEHEKINDAFKRYVENLELRLPAGGDTSAFLKQREDRFFDLVHEIGAYLGFRLDKRELDKFSYVPQGWNDIEFANAQMRRLVLEVLSGQRPLPVALFKGDAGGKFPPAPTT
jgi:uncharacterized protein DUF6680